MKGAYNAPEMEIITFDAEDVITTSLTNGGNAKDLDASAPDITL